MSKSLKWILISVGILLVLMVVLSKAGVFGKDEGIKVTAEKAQKRTITEIVNASGKIYPEIEVKISPDISGEITELNVKEGDSVKKGQVLARIYADIYNIQRNQAASGVEQTQAQVANSQAAIDALKAQMEQAQKTYDRQKKLFDDKVISKSEFEVADANLKSSKANYNAALQGIRGGQASVQSARASLEKANKDLSRTAVIATMDGVVSLLNVKQGERVVGSNLMSGTEMLRIADMAKIEIRVDVGENDVPKVKLGDSALIDVDAYTDRKFKGIVTQIASSNNGAATQSALASTSSDVTQYKVYIRLLPESYKDLLGKGAFPFRPGMSANADIQTKTHVNVMSVPINAVTTRDKNDSLKTDKKKADEESSLKPASETDDDLEVVVFIIDKEGKVSKKKVKTDIQDINYIEITEGLKEGEEVVTGPYDVVSKTLKTGKKVKVVDKKELFEKK
ncbi:MAG: efflux RND transporter periplasmic adaptor subunit [Ferruginibacter sp.]|nr:efflux RND transporter periplasmic adaptor subunit [Chitinophagaceae bacterium]MBP6285344.1 efflux RND transporter periplasmic adaptor subunit [Ferruginibacter sp.]MBU9935815.1 efflux RND transporter periplasmic adaptor subunit [Ferruginibacter sp.]HQY10926.1 efflux RND transporter periplasmic adaptor subunit [Ferruginibacter sp.]